MKIKYFGHSAFLISSNNTNILFDPFLKNNPLSKTQPENIKADYILISHGHGDHLGDAIEIAKRNNSTIIAPFELGLYCESKNVKVHTMHIGGAYDFDFGKVRLTQANHGSSVIEKSGIFKNSPNIIYTGNPCGFIVEIEGKNLYFAGDTGLFGDMELYQKYYGIDVAILPIGGNYTMDIDDAMIAVDLLNPKVVIPMHYNTFDLIKVDVDKFVNKVEKKGIKAMKIEYDGEFDI